MKRMYLAMFWLPKPQREHAKLVEVIRAAAVGDIKQFPITGGVAFMFESEVLPWNLSFSKILLNGDSRIIFEVGEKVSMDGFGAAQGWLNTRRPRQ